MDAITTDAGVDGLFAVFKTAGGSIDAFCVVGGRPLVTGWRVPADVTSRRGSLSLR